jgi:cyclomaltodextrinase / maltogenic alpha-amylase / neopullulanase
LMGWLIGEGLPSYVFDIGDYRKYLRPLDAVGFANWIDYLLGLYDPAINFVQLNLLDSHDTARFITIAGDDQSALKLGWLFLFTYIGAPCIYYGDEVGLCGGPDPFCRDSFPWNKQEWNQDLRSFVKHLTSLRHAHPALRRGDYNRLYAKDNIYAFSRCTPDEKIIVVINAGRDTTVTDIPLTGFDHANGSWKTLFGDAQASVDAGKLMGLKLAPRSGIILGK